jgi:hypothetical protein
MMHLHPRSDGVHFGVQARQKSPRKFIQSLRSRRSLRFMIVLRRETALWINKP